MNFKWCILLLIVGVALQSCVSYKPQYRGEWSRQSTVIDPYYTVYLIGDAGNISVEEKSDVFNHLKNELDLEDENAAIVWLGDNIYPVGLAPKQSVYYKEGKNKLLAQLKSMENFKGQKFFIPGNHDWYSFGRIGLRRQELFVDSFLMTTPNPTSQNNFFLPDHQVLLCSVIANRCGQQMIGYHSPLLRHPTR